MRQQAKVTQEKTQEIVYEGGREVIYDSKGRMSYHPIYHPNTNKPWTVSDIEYLCKYYNVDDLNTLALALGRTAVSISVKANILKRKGQFEHYKNLNKFW